MNMVLFAKSVLRQTNEEAANTFSRLMGTLYISSLMGAFLSDSYLGRYMTCSGFVALSISTHSFLLKPRDVVAKLGSNVILTQSSETALFYISIYLIAIGNGAPELALNTFGADQFDEEDPKETQSKSSFYSYFYAALNLGYLFSQTVLVYVENIGYWVLVFCICAGCVIFAFLLLLSGTFRYRTLQASGNPLSRFSHVIVVSMRKINLQVPSNGEELHERKNETICSRRILHSNDFKKGENVAVDHVFEQAGMVEQHRLKYASKTGQETSSLSIFWQTPQYVLLGVVENLVFFIICAKCYKCISMEKWEVAEASELKAML
ncbi:hypothetical protein Ddye_018066 [Dipteronia dyeriana]|uniref:Uncharacterized protein n=1 Tax=Dipteronia dyeriana TaxID=168575 RepID=A0AAD9UAK0_9ROSI|nr:hypothetical protein Ddye_018066 [Dipteronia dyeriana]